MSTPFSFETTSYEGEAEGDVAVAPVEEAKPEAASAPDKPAESSKDVADQTKASADKMSQTFREMMKSEEPAKKEAAAEPEKPAETKPEALDDQPKKSADWKKVKSELETAQKQVADLNSKLEKATKTTAVPKEFEEKLAAITKERDELSVALQRADVEHHPKFKGYFDGKFKTAVDLAKSAVPAELTATVEKALKISDSDARNERIKVISEELDDFQKARLFAAATRYEEIDLERRAELSRAGESKSKLEEQSKAESEARSKETEFVFAKVVDEAVTKNEFFKSVENNEKWNTAVKADLELAKNVFMGKDMAPDDLARASLWAVAGPKIYATVINLSKELQKAQAQLAKMRVATPGVGAGGRTESPNGAMQSPESGGSNFASNFRKAMQGT